MGDVDRKPIAYEAYQELADSYSALIDTKPHNAYYDRPATLSLLPDVDGKRVLDAGCGPGAYTLQLCLRGASVTAIDISERMLQLATDRLEQAGRLGQVEFILADMTRPLPMLDDGFFDVVVAPLCLDYIEDWTSLFTEFRRVLKPGGTFVFSVGHPSFDADYFETRDYFSVEQVECTWKGFGKQIVMPSYRRSIQELLMPVIDAGFLLESILEPLPIPKFRESDPVRYDQLMQRPVFICISARNPG